MIPASIVSGNDSKKWAPTVDGHTMMELEAEQKMKKTDEKEKMIKDWMSLYVVSTWNDQDKYKYVVVVIVFDNWCVRLCNRTCP